MGLKTGVGWTDATANFWIGCFKVSPECENCYAEIDTPARVLRAKGLEVWGPPKITPRYRTKSAWKQVPALNRAAARKGVRKRLFVQSQSDFFEDHPMVSLWRAEALGLLETCTNLDVQLLTKRPENVHRMVPPSWMKPGGWPDHIWIGTTVGDQKRAEQRIPHLRRVPARVRFLSCEPLLEAVDLSPWLRTPIAGDPSRAGMLCSTCGHPAECHWQEEGDDDSCGAGDECPCSEFTGAGISWVIVGGESGSRARPFDLAWARSVVAQCREAGVPVFVKQMGARPIDSEAVQPGIVEVADRVGANPSEWPDDLRVQQFPAAA